MDFSGKVVRVGTVNYSNIYVVRKTATGEYEGVSGIEHEFMKVLSKAMNFTYEVVIPRDNTWGRLLKNGTWSGIFGDLLRNDADIGIGTLNPLYARLAAADFSFPYQVSSLTFVIKKAGFMPRHFVYFRPFHFYMWILCFLSLLACSILISALKTFAVDGKVRERKMPFFLRKVVSAAELLTGNADLLTIRGKTYVKWFTVLCILCFRILTFSYTGLLLAFLMMPILEPQISTVFDLVEASLNERTKVTTYAHTTFQARLLNGEGMVYKVIGEYARDHLDEFLSTSENFRPWIENGYSIMGSKEFIELHVYSRGLVEETFISKDILETLPFAIAIRKGFPFKKPLDKMITRMYQSGIYDKLYSDHLYRLLLKTGESNDRPDNDIRAIAISDVIGMFWIVLICYFFSVVVLFLERWCSRIKKRKVRPDHKKIKRCKKHLKK